MTMAIPSVVPDSIAPDTLEEYEHALQMFLHGNSVEPSESYSDEVNVRLQSAPQHAQDAAAKVPHQVQLQVRRLLTAGINATSSAKRVLWLHRAADALSSAYAPHSGCSKGCSSCCHIPVKISEIEARELGKAIGRMPEAFEIHQPVEIKGYGHPCPFLHEDACSIYDKRPAVCRTHLNMDKDGLLCQLDSSGAMNPVPYLDTRLFMLFSFETGGDPKRWGDLRQWFPSPAGGDQGARS